MIKGCLWIIALILIFLILFLSKKSSYSGGIGTEELRELRQMLLEGAIDEDEFISLSGHSATAMSMLRKQPDTRRIIREEKIQPLPVRVPHDPRMSQRLPVTGNFNRLCLNNIIGALDMYWREGEVDVDIGVSSVYKTHRNVPWSSWWWLMYPGGGGGIAAMIRNGPGIPTPDPDPIESVTGGEFKKHRLKNTSENTVTVSARDKDSRFMSELKDSISVAIIGAGPGGLVSSIFFHKIFSLYGIRHNILIYESRDVEEQTIKGQAQLTITPNRAQKAFMMSVLLPTNYYEEQRDPYVQDIWHAHYIRERTYKFSARDLNQVVYQYQYDPFYSGVYPMHDSDKGSEMCWRITVVSGVINGRYRSYAFEDFNMPICVLRDSRDFAGMFGVLGERVSLDWSDGVGEIIVEGITSNAKKQFYELTRSKLEKYGFDINRTILEIQSFAVSIHDRKEKKTNMEVPLFINQSDLIRYISYKYKDNIRFSLVKDYLVPNPRDPSKMVCCNYAKMIQDNRIDIIVDATGGRMGAFKEIKRYCQDEDISTVSLQLLDDPLFNEHFDYDKYRQRWYMTMTLTLIPLTGSVPFITDTPGGMQFQLRYNSKTARLYQEFYKLRNFAEFIAWVRKPDNITKYYPNPVLIQIPDKQLEPNESAHKYFKTAFISKIKAYYRYYGINHPDSQAMSFSAYGVYPGAHELMQYGKTDPFDLIMLDTISIHGPININPHISDFMAQICEVDSKYQFITMLAGDALASVPFFLGGSFNNSIKATYYGIFELITAFNDCQSISD